MKEERGWHYYPTVENDLYMSGVCDLYYGLQEHYKLKGEWSETGCEKTLQKAEELFNRVQYVIYKNKTVPTEIILLDYGLMLDWDTEFDKGLDAICVQHLWQPPYGLTTAYRFANGFNLDPIGTLSWTAPDMFHWHKSYQT